MPKPYTEGPAFTGLFNISTAMNHVRTASPDGLLFLCCWKTFLASVHAERQRFRFISDETPDTLIQACRGVLQALEVSASTVPHIRLWAMFELTVHKLQGINKQVLVHRAAFFLHNAEAQLECRRRCSEFSIMSLGSIVILK
jgi:hypothetical protein